MKPYSKGGIALLASCLTIFWPGAFIFSFPGLLGPHWQQAFQVGKGAVGQTLFFVLVAVGLFMFFVGRWQEKIGPTWLTAIGALLCGVCTMLLGKATSIVHVYAWSFVIGASSAFVYIPTITVAQQWYPHKKGLVSGVVSLVFGLSAALISPVFARLLNYMTHEEIVFAMGLVSLVLTLAAVPFVRFPVKPAPASPEKSQKGLFSERDLTVSQTLKTKAFWFLWLAWTLTGAAGIAMVTLSTSFGLARGLDIREAVLILTAFNLTNGLSRLASGFLSDFIGRGVTISLACLAAGCAYFLMPYLEGIVTWCVLAAAVGYAFGTLFAVSAPLASDHFGLTHFGAIFGLVFTGYGFIAGPLGPWLSGLLLDVSGGNFKLVFSYLGFCCIISAVCIGLIRSPGNR